MLQRLLKFNAEFGENHRRVRLRCHFWFLIYFFSAGMSVFQEKHCWIQHWNSNSFHPPCPQSIRCQCKAFALCWIWNWYCYFLFFPLLRLSAALAVGLTSLTDNGSGCTAYWFVCLDTSLGTLLIRSLAPRGHSWWRSCESSTKKTTTGHLSADDEHDISERFVFCASLDEVSDESNLVSVCLTDTERYISGRARLRTWARPSSQHCDEWGIL